MMDNDHVSYPVFKGLKKPLEFMGLQGRYIYWAALSIGAAFLGFIIVYSLVGFLFGIIVLFSSLLTGGVLILIKQRKGLHSKRILKGIYVFKGYR